MSGVLFVICIPSSDHELTLLRKKKRKVTIGCPETVHYDRNSSSNFLHYVSPVRQAASPSNKKKQHKSMEKILENVISQQAINNATWCRGNNTFIQVTFSVESNEDCDKILKELQEHGIGKKFNSVVSVIPCTVHFHSSPNNTDPENEESCSESYKEHTTAWNRFVSSVRSRLAVAHVVENVKHHAALTFDFICLILISTTMCAIGLTENSNVYLMSSVLICPMMGPVMATTFGSVIQDRGLQKIGVQNELLGLGIAMIVGFCYGSVICIITDKYGTQGWPTYEMISRGELRSLWVGCLIALISGAAVALGILSDNIASLVGVAISTSLMPPAVNAGLLWSMASVYYIKGDESTRYSSLSFISQYSDNKAMELLALAGVSVCFTIVNIVCIYLAGILVFKIKEVAPIASRDHHRRRFWNHDIKIARDFNKIDCQDSQHLYDTLYKANLNEKDCLCHSTDLAHENFKINIKRPEYTWSPCMPITKRQSKDFWENRTGPVRFKNTPKYRRLSQIFNQNNADSDKFNISSQTNEKTPLLGDGGECSSRSKSFLTKTKEFIVTPCDEGALNV